MIAIIKTNNPVTLSYAQSVLDDQDIDSFIADQHSGNALGFIGLITSRLMVIDADVDEAREVLAAAGLEDELCPI